MVRQRPVHHDEMEIAFEAADIEADFRAFLEKHQINFCLERSRSGTRAQFRAKRWGFNTMTIAYANNAPAVRWYVPLGEKKPEPER